MVKLCPLFAHTIKTKGAEQPGVTWHKILHTLAYCEDGGEYIHQMSSGHDSYSEKNVNQRFAYAKEQRRLRPSIGPTRCDKFAEHAPQCTTCEWRKRIVSPIKLAYGMPSDLPWPFRNAPGGVERKDSEDGWGVVIRYNVEGLEAAVHYGVGTDVKLRIGKTQVDANLVEFVDNRSVQLLLARYGLNLDTHELESLRKLMTSWMHQLRSTDSLASNSVSAKQYGWAGTGFKYDGVLYGADGSKTPTFTTDKGLDDVYTQAGELKVWALCANHILSQPRPAAWCAVASAFAAPLIKFTGTNGSLLSIISRETGTGKSTALKVAQSVWAHPRLAMSSLNDTDNSVSYKMGILNSLPAYWDEIRGRQDVQRFTKMIFRLSQGKEKERLTPTITQRKPGDWATMLTIASNEAIQDHMTHLLGGTDAGAARVFELTIGADIKDNMNDAQARHFYRALESNYGCAGAIYAKHLATNHEHVNAMVRQLDSALSAKLKSTSGERFWMATMATLITGAVLANKLDICKFNVQKLTSYLVKEFKRMRSVLAKENPVGGSRAIEMLTRFLHLSKDYTIVASTSLAAGMIYMDSERQPATVRVARDEGAIRIIRKDFTDWIYEEEGAGSTQLLHELTQFGVLEVFGSIDVGTARGMNTRHRCLEIQTVGVFAHLGPDNPNASNGDLG